MKSAADGASRRNWHRGLLRAWLVLSVLWVALIVAASGVGKNYEEYLNAKDLVGKAEAAGQKAAAREASATDIEKPAVREDRKELALIAAEARRRVELRWSTLMDSLKLMVAIPVVTLAIGYAVGWVVVGFRGTGGQT